MTTRVSARRAAPRRWMPSSRNSARTSAARPTLVVRGLFAPNADPKLVDRVAKDMASAPPAVALSALHNSFCERGAHSRGSRRAQTAGGGHQFRSRAHRPRIAGEVRRQGLRDARTRALPDARRSAALQSLARFRRKGVCAMKSVTGIGGIFIKSAEPAENARLVPEASRHRHRGLGRHAHFAGPGLHNPDGHGTTVWNIFEASSGYFAPSQAPFMVNYRVDKLRTAARGVARRGLPGRRQDATSPNTASSAGWSIPTATRSNCGSRRKASSHDRQPAGSASFPGPSRRSTTSTSCR